MAFWKKPAPAPSGGMGKVGLGVIAATGIAAVFAMATSFHRRHAKAVVEVEAVKGEALVQTEMVRTGNARPEGAEPLWTAPRTSTRRR